MKPALSIAIPAHNEAKYIARCIESVALSADLAHQRVEVVVALNRCTDQTREIAESLGARCVVNDMKCIAAVRNAAVRATSASTIATLDADSWMSPKTVSAVLAHIAESRFVGGGTLTWPERISTGILFSLLAVAPYIIKRGVSTGMFWCSRDSFEAVGGFDESLVSAEDIDFALRLKAYGEASGRLYGTIRRHGITTSCRKFDQFGDWFLLRNPGIVKEIFKGTNRRAADLFYYDIER